MTVVRAAISQTSWTGDVDSMLDQREQFARDVAARGAHLDVDMVREMREDRQFYRDRRPDSCTAIPQP